MQLLPIFLRTFYLAFGFFTFHLLCATKSFC